MSKVLVYETAFGRWDEDAIEKIAQVCHEANRAVQTINLEGDISPAWDDAPAWQKESAREGVVKALIYGYTAEELHESWTAHKKADGWVYGEVKDADAKTHPCLVPYKDLPASQRLKDYVFAGVIEAFVQHAS